MTDNFLQRLEEKVMILLTELESLRKEMNHLRHENSTLKAEKLNYTKKMQALIALLDSLDENQISVVAGDVMVSHDQDEFVNA